MFIILKFVIITALILPISGPVFNWVGADTNNNNQTIAENDLNMNGDQQPRSQQLPPIRTEQKPSDQRQGVVPDHAPNAIAGTDKKVNEGSTVILDASRSSDPDAGDKITYLWKQIGGLPLASLGFSADDKIASFVAPSVDRDIVLTYSVTVTDQKGLQDRDIVKVSVKNTQQNNPAVRLGNKLLTSNTGIVNSNGITNNQIGNGTQAALINAQRNNNNVNLNSNNNINATNLSKIQSTLNAVTAASNQVSTTASFTTQVLTNGQANPTNNIVNTRAWYEIVFRAGTTATIGKIDMTFPAGTNIANAALIERSGIGSGSSTKSGQTITYTISNPVSVASSTIIRLEYDNILNPPTPAANIAVQIATKDSGGNTIETGSSLAYSIKQIGTGDIADNAVSSAKIAIDAVTADKIAGVSKLIFASCVVDPPELSADGAFTGECSVPGASQTAGDMVIVTSNGRTPCCFLFTLLKVPAAVVSKDGTVSVALENEGSQPFDYPPQLLGIIVFHP